LSTIRAQFIHYIPKSWGYQLGVSAKPLGVLFYGKGIRQIN